MASTLKSRSNHYETLGLGPDASSDAIVRAYAREVGIFGSRPVVDVARASIAFETLRDPERRRAYDQSLGFGAKTQPRIVSTGGRAQFVAVPAPAPFELPDGMPETAAQPRREPASEARTASFIAASLRPAAVPVCEPPPAPEPDAQRSPLVEPTLDRPTASGLRLADVDDSPVQLSRTVAIGGGLIGCVALLGVLLGVEAGKGEQAEPAQAAVTATLPPATPPKPQATPVSLESDGLAAIQPPQSSPARVRTAAIAPPPQVADATAPTLSLAETAPPPAVMPDELAPTQAVADPAPVATAAALPLSNATIARTIERIGYSCGRVASASPDASGATGVFTVTCTSGQSYRAAPVKGRYRFRRVAG